MRSLTVEHCCSLTVEHCCLLTVLHFLSFTVLHCCSLTVEHCCSLTVEHCCLFTVEHCCSYLVWHFCSHSGSLKHWPMSVLLLTKLQSFLGTAEGSEAKRRQRTSGDTLISSISLWRS